MAPSWCDMWCAKPDGCQHWGKVLAPLARSGSYEEIPPPVHSLHLIVSGWQWGVPTSSSSCQLPLDQFYTQKVKQDKQCVIQLKLMATQKDLISAEHGKIPADNLDAKQKLKRRSDTGYFIPKKTVLKNI